jgi:hypothetical protein
MLDKIKRDGQQQSVINNLYNSTGGSGAPSGGPLSSGAGGGIAASMGGGSSPAPAPEGDDPFSYLVDIIREDLPINPDTGKPSGWKKAVKRYRVPKGEETPPK